MNIYRISLSKVFSDPETNTHSDEGETIVGFTATFDEAKRVAKLHDDSFVDLIVVGTAKESIVRLMKAAYGFCDFSDFPILRSWERTARGGLKETGPR